jgi:hypothetical protein
VTRRRLHCHLDLLPHMAAPAVPDSLCDVQFKHIHEYMRQH